MSRPEDDPVVSVLPIHLSTSLSPNVHLHQFPLLTRPLQVPPSAAQSGKKIRARLKQKSARLEVHVPVDTRPEVWNKERAQELGQARIVDDAEKDMISKQEKDSNVDPRLTEVRMRSEQVPSKGAYMLGIVRDGQLHLHPISQTHQFRPTLSYMDVFHRKARRKPNGEEDSDDDDGPPPDPDDPNPPSLVKKELKVVGETKEVTVSVRKTDDKGMNSQSLSGGMSVIRREMLQALREEEDEPWQEYTYCDGESEEASEAFNSVFSKSDQKLSCQSDLTTFLKSIPGL